MPAAVQAPQLLNRHRQYLRSRRGARRSVDLRQRNLAGLVLRWLLVIPPGQKLCKLLAFRLGSLDRLPPPLELLLCLLLLLLPTHLEGLALPLDPQPGLIRLRVDFFDLHARVSALSDR